MNIVIVGAKDRHSPDDIADVETLLAKLEIQYGVVTIVSAICHLGIGKVVKQLSSKPAPGRDYRFPFVDIDIRVYANTLTKDAMSQLYTCRNAMLFEVGDMFYSFPHPQRRAVLDELIEKRVIPSGRPFKVFQPGDDIEIS